MGRSASPQDRDRGRDRSSSDRRRFNGRGRRHSRSRSSNSSSRRRGTGDGGHSSRNSSSNTIRSNNTRSDRRKDDDRSRTHNHNHSSSSSSSSNNRHTNRYSTHKSNRPQQNNNNNNNNRKKPPPNTDLPSFAVKEILLSTLDTHPIVVCVGETGSGKTTQIPQYLLEHLISQGNNTGLIGVTQPRRVAAVSVAKRVAEEQGCALGQTVGYSIRFDDKTTPERTRVKFMTDGVLVRECLQDPDLSAYSVIMLDEAHERSVHTDILFGLLKQIVKRRNEQPPSSSCGHLHVLITSATLDQARFSTYFDNCPVLEIPGRSFPVQIYHVNKPASIINARYVHQAVDTAMRIHLVEPPGDVLIFLTGQSEITRACRELSKRWAKEMKTDVTRASTVPQLLVVPLYGALSGDRQQLVFKPAPKGTRKVIIATNIAETSITVDGVRYVIDPGFVKQKVHRPERGMDALVVTPVSRTSAQQRAGRAGRTAAGKCYRLYNLQQFEDRDEDTVPEIQRADLVATVLQLKVLGVVDVLAFDFLDQPHDASLRDALKELYWLGAIDNDGKVTSIGTEMSRFPLQPHVSRVLLKALELGCLDDAITVAALLSVEHVFVRSGGGGKGSWDNGNNVPTGFDDVEDHEAHVAEKHVEFYHKAGDHITLLKVYEAWVAAGRTEQWCKEHYMHLRALRQVYNIRQQLLEQVEPMRRRSGSSSGVTASGRDGNSSVDVSDNVAAPASSRGENFQRLRQSFCAGYFSRAATLVSSRTFRAMVPADDGSTRIIHVDPSSTFALLQAPACVLYTELVATSKLHMRNVLGVDRQWLEAYLPLLHSFDTDQLSGRVKPIDVEVEVNGQLTISGADVGVDHIATRFETMKREPTSVDTVSAARLRFMQRKKAAEEQSFQ